MISDEDWESNTFFFLRTLSFARMVLYAIAMFVQLVVLIWCYMTSGYCDIFTVLVPLSMIFVEVMMMTRGREFQQWFYFVYLLVNVLSIFVVFTAMVTIIFTGFLFPMIFIEIPSTIDEHIMRFLSYGVLVVSLILIMILIYLTSPKKLKVVGDDEDDWLHSTNH